jgi:glycine/D-amino acid oxidase-like deaminating enzyme
MTQGRTIWLDQLTPGERAALDPGLPDAIIRRPDVLVVGGGAQGVLTAAACHAAGAGTVLLIEADRLAAGSTGGAAGLLTPEAHHGNDPLPLVDFLRNGFAGWQHLAKTAGPHEMGPHEIGPHEIGPHEMGPHEIGPRDIGLQEIDWLALAPHPDGFLADPSPAVQWLDAGQIQDLLPGLSSPTTGAPTTGALIRRQARINPVRALARLAPGIPQIATGCPATAVTTRAGRVTAVTTAAGDITPGHVVFATGLPPRLPGLPTDATSIPAGTVKGHLVVTEPVPVTLPGTVTGLGTQLEDHRLLAGGTLDTDDPTTEVNPEVTERIRRDVAAALPLLAGVRLSHRWCCWRPRHPDGLPVVDLVPGLGNAWVTSGHYRTGILSAPAVGSALARWIVSGRRPRELDPWRIEGRFTPERARTTPAVRPPHPT